MNQSYKIQIVQLFRVLKLEIEGKPVSFAEHLVFSEYCNRKIHPVYRLEDGRIFVALRNGNEENLHFAHTRQRKIFINEFSEIKSLANTQTTESFLSRKM